MKESHRQLVEEFVAKLAYSEGWPEDSDTSDVRFMVEEMVVKPLLEEKSCARDQNTTQFCYEAVEAHRKLAIAEEALATISKMRWFGPGPTTTEGFPDLRSPQAVAKQTLDALHGTSTDRS